MTDLLKIKRFVWAAIFALVTAVALLSYFSGARYLAAERAVEHTLAVQSAINSTLSLLKDAETGQRGYLLTGDPQFMEPYDAARRDIPGLFARLAVATQNDQRQISRLSAVRELTAQKYATLDAMIQLRRGSEMTQVQELLLRGKAIMDQLRAQCRLMLDHEEHLLAERRKEADNAKLTATWGVGIGSLVTIVLSLVSLVTVHRDAEELKRTAEELAASEEHYRQLTEQSTDLVRLLALDGTATYVSPSVEHMLGYTAEEFKAQPAQSLMHPDDAGKERRLLQDLRDGEIGSGTMTYRLRHKSGEYRWFEVLWAVRRDARGIPDDIHTTGRDVTERREAEQQVSAYADELRKLSLCDELTGLYNRRGFLEVAAQAHRQATRDARAAALIFIDLNGMKRINDELGHDAGDTALVDTAGVLKATLAESDVLARLGGDEFAAFALDFSAADLDSLRHRLRQQADDRVRELARPFRLSMSVGAAYMAADGHLGISELLDRADAAMYEQKNARRAAGNVSVPPLPPSGHS